MARMRCFAGGVGVAIVTLACSVVAVPSCSARVGPQEGEALSVEETLAAVFAGETKHGRLWHLYRNANKDADKAALYRLLQNQQARLFHPSAIVMLGYVGDASDCEKLKEHIDRDLKNSRIILSIERGKRETLTAAFTSLGIMARRGIGEAKRIVERMTRVAYWEGAKGRWCSENDAEIAHGTVYETISVVIEGYARAGNDDVKAIAAGVLERIEDPKTRKYMEGRISSDKLARSARRTREAEQKPITHKNREMLAYRHKKNAAMFADKSELSEAEQAFIKQVTKEARDEFENLKSRVVKGDFKALAGSLLDNWRIVTPEKVQRQWAEYTKALEREKQVFESLAEIDPHPVDYRIERLASYEFPSVNEKGTPVGVKKTEDVSVSFRLSKSNEIGSVLFRRLRGSRTVAKDGALIVVMKRIDGKWYWNPFGW